LGTAALLPLSASAQTATATLVCNECAVTSISADGLRATGQFRDNWETFSWRQGHPAKRLGRSTADNLGVVGGVPAISANGKTIASSILSDDGTLMTSGIWTHRSGWTQLTPLPADAGSGDQQDSSVWTLSGDGKTAAGLYWRYGHTGGTAHPMYWTAESGMVDLTTAGGSGRINGIDYKGKVMAGWEEGSWGNWVATVWAGGTRTEIGNPDGWSIAYAVSDTGKTVVGQDQDPVTYQNTATAWHWNGASWDKTDLGVLKGTVDGGASATGVSSNGKVVVGCGNLYWGPGGSGWVWTKKSGKLTLATKFFAKYGYADPAYDIAQVVAVTPDGKSFAIYETQSTPPFATRSQIITLSESVD
jgi:hypothetical protein